MLALWPASTPAVSSDEARLVAALGDIVTGHATVADAMTIVQFAWEIACEVNPGLAALSTAEGIAVQLVPLIASGIASGSITPGSGANADPLGRGGRRG
jgi:hypothetical protein